MLTPTHTAIIIGLAIYAIVMLGISIFFMFRVSKPADYLMAGRGRSTFILVGVITGMCIGTGVFIGATGLAYQHGWAGSAWPFGLGLGTLLAGIVFAGMRRHRFMTLSEEIACYYCDNRAVVEFSNVALFFSQLCWLTVQIMGGAALLGEFTGMSRETCMALAGLVTAAFAVPGGLKAIVYINSLQTLILLTGFFLLVYSALSNSGGLAGLTQDIPPARLSLLGAQSYGAWKVFGLIFTLLLAVFADPGRRQAMFTARSTAGARTATITAGAIVMLFSVSIGIAGMYAWKLNPGLTAKYADQALPWLIMNVLPSWLAALVVVSIVSGIFSAANSNAIAGGTFFVRHIYPLAAGRPPKNPMLATRAALVGAFLIATIAGMLTSNIVDFVKNFLGIVMSGMAVVILAGRFWKRATWQGALAALITAPIVSLATKIFPAPDGPWATPAIPAFAAGLAALIIASLLTPPRTRAFAQVAAQMRQAREAIEAPQGSLRSQIPN